MAEKPKPERGRTKRIRLVPRWEHEVDGHEFIIEGSVFRGDPFTLYNNDTGRRMRVGHYHSWPDIYAAIDEYVARRQRTRKKEELRNEAI